MPKATLRSKVEAGIGVWGIKESLHTIADQCKVDIEMKTYWGILERTVHYKVVGEENNVRSFQRTVQRWGKQFD